MKTKIVLGLATLAALALPAMAEEGNRYRDRDDQRAIYTQNYRYDADASAATMATIISARTIAMTTGVIKLENNASGGNRWRGIASTASTMVTDANQSACRQSR